MLLAAGRLFVLALVPMLVMALPVTLLLGQLGLWYRGPAAAGRRGGGDHPEARRRSQRRPGRL